MATVLTPFSTRSVPKWSDRTDPGAFSEWKVAPVVQGVESGAPVSGKWSPGEWKVAFLSSVLAPFCNFSHAFFYDPLFMFLCSCLLLSCFLVFFLACLLTCLLSCFLVFLLAFLFFLFFVLSYFLIFLPSLFVF